MSSFHRTGPPSESLTTFQPSDLSAGAAFHEVSAPFNGILDRAPYGTGTTRANPGSALRFSQPLSGFLARSSSTALFHAATVPGLLPFRAFPPQGSVVPSRVPLAPAVIHQPAERTPLGLIATGFPDSRALDALAVFPPATMDSLSTSSRPLSGRPGPRADKPLVRLASPAWKPTSPCESVRTNPANRASSRCSLGFFPFKDPSKPRILDPPEPESPNTRPSKRSEPRPSEPATMGTCDPLSRVRLARCRNTGSASSAASDPLRDRAAPPLSGVSFSPDLPPDGCPPDLAFRASKCLGGRRLSRRRSARLS
jgi:hypothetical protein